jgi:hypothetical protein
MPQRAQGTTFLRYAVAFQHWEQITLFFAVMTLVPVDPEKPAEIPKNVTVNLAVLC